MTMPTQSTTYRGSVSHGTLRTCDLVAAFILFLEGEGMDPQADADISVPDEAWGDDASAFWDSEEADFLLHEDLFPAMDALAPEGVYFGSHEGDGADFGYWEEQWWDEQSAEEEALAQEEGWSDPMGIS